MGTGIGIVARRVAGLNVTFVDPSEKQLVNSEGFIEKWCDKEIAKERMNAEEKQKLLEGISFGDSINYMKDADFVVEAAKEDFAIKRTIFTHLAEATPAHAILATNTSSISITKIAGCIPQRAH
jgi:3-hydroxybutyryl-CoA dehydrogenase